MKEASFRSMQPGPTVGNLPCRACARVGAWLGVVSLFFGAMVNTASGQITGPMFTFDDTNSLAPWYMSWGVPWPAIAWDNRLDSTNNPNSGSLRVTQNFTGSSNEFFAVNGLFLDSSNQPVVVDVSRYIYLKLDYKVGPGTAPDPNGTYGVLEVGTVSSNWGHTAVATLSIPSSATNWTHLQPLLPLWQDFGTVVGLYVQIGSWFGNLTNTMVLNVDNLGLGGGYCCAPPRLWLERADPEPGYWLKWSPPAPTARVQVCTNVAANDWYDTGLETNAVTVSGGIGVPVPSASAGAMFWRLWLGSQ